MSLSQVKHHCATTRGWLWGSVSVRQNASLYDSGLLLEGSTRFQTLSLRSRNFGPHSRERSLDSRLARGCSRLSWLRSTMTLAAPRLPSTSLVRSLLTRSSCYQRMCTHLRRLSRGALPTLTTLTPPPCAMHCRRSLARLPALPAYRELQHRLMRACVFEMAAQSTQHRRWPIAGSRKEDASPRP